MTEASNCEICGRPLRQTDTETGCLAASYRKLGYSLENAVGIDFDCYRLGYERLKAEIKQKNIVASDPQMRCTGTLVHSEFENCPVHPVHTMQPIGSPCGYSDGCICGQNCDDAAAEVEVTADAEEPIDPHEPKFPIP